MKKYTVLNPATGEIVREYIGIDNDALEGLITDADNAYKKWRETPLEERAAVLGRVADLIERDMDSLALISMIEVGKIKAVAVGELKVVVGIFRYYADNAEALMKPDYLPTASVGKAYVTKEPIGVILGIEPWNYPYYQPARVIAPNLLLGNTVLVKPASQTPESCLQFDRLLEEAGAPKGVYSTALISSNQISMMLADKRIQGVTLTGSENAGAAVAAEAGKNLKKAVLELGGSDPFIVLDSADIPSAIQAVVLNRVNNAGQTCNAPKRLIVTEGVADAFIGALTHTVGALVMDDPMKEGTQIGPVSSVQAAEELQEQLQDAIDKGATVLVPGGRQGDGAFFKPVVLTDITPEMRIYEEEVFGPIFMVYRAKDNTDAVRIANDTAFGLGSALFATDETEAQDVASKIDAGMVFVNRGGTSAADIPFGGIKRSGFGRELGTAGITEFANRKLYVGLESNK